MGEFDGSSLSRITGLLHMTHHSFTGALLGATHWTKYFTLITPGHSQDKLMKIDSYLNFDKETCSKRLNNMP